MSFVYRLSYFLFGLLGGCIFLYFIFNQKKTSCNYFPNARVLNNIRSKPFHYSEIASKKLAEEWLDTIDIKNTLEFGEVDFDRSNKVIGTGKLYVVIGKTTKNEPIEVTIENYEKKAVLRDIKKP